MAVEPPMMRRFDTEDGPEWEVCYGGVCRRHRQPWQAQWLWIQAQSAYGLDAVRNQPVPAPSASHRGSQLARL